MGIRDALVTRDNYFHREIKSYLLSTKDAPPTEEELKEKLVANKEGILYPFHPSGVNECARYNQYDMVGVEGAPNFGLREIQYLERGTANHDVWLDMFKKVGFRVRELPPFEFTNPSVRSYRGGDWAAFNEEDGKEYLFEWKSTTSYKSWAEWHHQVQWQLYSHAYGLHDGYIVKQNPNDWNLVFIKMKYDKDFIENLFNWMRWIEKMSIDRQLIERDDKCGAGRPWKESCRRYDFCWGSLGDKIFINNNVNGS